MSWWKYKPMFALKWREPYGFSRTLNKLGDSSVRWWIRPLWVLFYATLFMTGWHITSLRRDSTSVTFITAFTLSVFAGSAIVYINHFAHYFAYRTIGLGEKAIVYMLGQSVLSSPYNLIESVVFSTVELKRVEYRMMTVITKDNKHDMICALPASVKTTDVIDLLMKNGITQIKNVEHVPPGQASPS